MPVLKLEITSQHLEPLHLVAFQQGTVEQDTWGAVPPKVKPHVLFVCKCFKNLYVVLLKLQKVNSYVCDSASKLSMCPHDSKQLIWTPT